MLTTIFYEDLSEEMQSRIRWALRYELEQEIMEAMESGIPRDTAEHEILADYINRHNAGNRFEL